MKLVVNIAGIRNNDPRRQAMLEKKAGLQTFCDEYEIIMKELLPEYAIDGVMPAIQIVPDRKTMAALRGFVKMISVGMFKNQPQFEWAVKKGAWPCRKVVYGDSKIVYVCGIPKEFPADRWRDLSKKIGEFYCRWTEGSDVRPGLIYLLRDE